MDAFPVPPPRHASSDTADELIGTGQAGYIRFLHYALMDGVMHDSAGNIASTDELR